MKQFTKSLFSALVALLVACSGGGTQVASNDGGISGTGNGSGKSSISGASYKGPMLQDSIIKLFPLLNGSISSTAIETRILSNVGDFTATVDNGTYSLQATGLYYEETTASVSTTEAELKAIAHITGSSAVFINVLTHLAHDHTVALIQTDGDYSAASDAAKTRTLALLKPITGEADISADFNAIGLDSTANDAAYLAYTSALILQTANDNASLTVNDILNELAEDVSSDADISEATLSALIISHANIDEISVDQNLQSIFNSNAIASIADTVATIDVFNPAMAAPTYAVTGSGASESYNFYFDGSSSDGSGGILDREILMGGSYQIQISTANDFSTLEITGSAIPSNTYQTLSSNFSGPGMRYVRVRKVKDNGQLSQWSGVLEFTPAP